MSEREVKIYIGSENETEGEREREGELGGSGDIPK